MLISRYGADIFAGLILKSKDRSDVPECYGDPCVTITDL